MRRCGRHRISPMYNLWFGHVYVLQIPVSSRRIDPNEISSSSRFMWNFQSVGRMQGKRLIYSDSQEFRFQDAPPVKTRSDHPDADDSSFADGHIRAKIPMDHRQMENLLNENPI